MIKEYESAWSLLTHFPRGEWYGGDKVLLLLQPTLTLTVEICDSGDPGLEAGQGSWG